MIYLLEWELWRMIPNSHYAVSTHGRIKITSHLKLHNINKTYYVTKDRIKVLSNNNSKKYWRVHLTYIDEVIKQEAVHRLVAKAFIPNPMNLPQVNHIDGNRNNNYYGNLEWCDQLHNMIHSWAIGLRDHIPSIISGENSNFNRHSEETIRKIPRLVEKGMSYTEIGKELGIARSLVSEVKNGRAWKHLNLSFPKKK